uniref:FXYD domain-containing ion transport regulator n=2 Tax=Mesocestoides corti TaxID=53468 RepID=A0A5K3FZB6_MESCO
MIDLMEPHIYKHPAQQPRDMDRYANMKFYLALTVLLLITFAGVKGRKLAMLNSIRRNPWLCLSATLCRLFCGTH